MNLKSAPVRQGPWMSKLSRGGCAGRGARRNWRDGESRIFGQRQTGEWEKHRNPLARFRLGSRLVVQLAVRAMGVIRGVVVVPTAADNRGKNQQRDQHQRNSRDAHCVSDGHSDGIESVAKAH